MKKEIAAQFGKALDQYNFNHAKELIHRDCKYDIGDTLLIGPDEICGSYEENMIAGRKKLDELEWGTARIETIDADNFYVHFTDYLTHKSKKYTHRCKQQLTVNDQNEIIQIKHIHDEEEAKRLNAYS